MRSKKSAPRVTAIASTRRPRISNLFALALLAPMGFASAQSTASFNLPAQGLAESLRAVAGQTNSNILFDRSLVTGVSARAVRPRRPS